MILTHQGATLCLLLTIVAITILELLVYRNIGVLKNFTIFFLALILTIILGIVYLQITNPALLHNFVGHGITSVTGMSTSLPINRPLGLFSYLGNLGILVLIFLLSEACQFLRKFKKRISKEKT